MNSGVAIYGECGGYMVLGRGIEDGDSVRHGMLGLLELETSFAKRRLHLGYRRLEAQSGFRTRKAILSARIPLFDCAARKRRSPVFGQGLTRRRSRPPGPARRKHLRLLPAPDRPGRRMIAHGGALDRAIARHGGTPGDWLDLSTGINPHGYPVGRIELQAWTRLPMDGDLEHLLAVARLAYGVPKHLDIVAAPGAQALIGWLPRLLPGATATVIAGEAGTYGEFAQCCEKVGRRVRHFAKLQRCGRRRDAGVCGATEQSRRIGDRAGGSCRAVPANGAPWRFRHRR